jgi:hypothetical protein
LKIEKVDKFSSGMKTKLLDGLKQDMEKYKRELED